MARALVHTNHQTAEALAELKELIRRNDTIYVSTVNVTRSGMSRTVKVFIARPGRKGYGNGRTYIRDITWLVGRALRWSTLDDGSWVIRLQGGGMDMHFHLTYSLASKLFNDGYALSKETI